jgi:hypothetical protein
MIVGWGEGNLRVPPLSSFSLQRGECFYMLRVLDFSQGYLSFFLDFSLPFGKLKLIGSSLMNRLI